MSNINDLSGGTKPAGQGGRAEDAIHKVSDTARTTAEKITEQTKSAADKATENAKAAADGIKTEAGKLAGDAAEGAKTFANENKGKVAEQFGGLSAALNKAADELDGSEQAMIAGYARQLASGMDNVSNTINDKGVEDLLSMAGDFARSQPAAFIGGAAVLGFLASRFAMSATPESRHPNVGSAGSHGRDDQPDIGVAPGSSYGQSEAMTDRGSTGTARRDVNEAFANSGDGGMSGTPGTSAGRTGGTF